VTRYRVPAGVHRVEEVIQRSRFMTTVARASDEASAHAFIRAIRDEHSDATHHCWAFVAGPPGGSAHVGMSDAGEPHGTAGKPMLTTLLHGGVGEIVAVCSRWYGGVKLGTGGLSRAYAGGVKLALESLPTEERVDRVRVEVVVGYGGVSSLQRLLEDLEGIVESEEYGTDVRYVCAVPEPALEGLRRAVADLTRGEGRVREI
jgi:uncharacterized YigZ family protein